MSGRLTGDRHQLREKTAARLAAYRLRKLLDRFQWFYQMIGVVGGFMFFVGSVFFLFDKSWQVAAVWLFIAGSFGMFIGNLGGVIVRHRVEKSEHHATVADHKPTEPIG